jgi:flagellin-like protein
MNKVIGPISGTLVTLAMTLALGGLAFAQSAPPAGQQTPKESAAPAQKPVTMRHVKAEIVSVNQQAKTVTVKRRHGREITLAVADEAATHLGDLKPGDQVRIGYKRVNKRLTAEEIVHNQMAKTK